MLVALIWLVVVAVQVARTVSLSPQTQDNKPVFAGKTSVWVNDVF